MRYPAAETADKHARVLAEASRLFREQGLSRVSIGNVMKAAALTHGSFYNHFASKQALIAECIDFVRDRHIAKIAAAEPTAAGFVAFIADYLSVAARDSPGTSCLMPTLGPEIAREPTARPAMSRYVAGFLERISTHFPIGRSEAIVTVATVVGAMVLARGVDDEALSREILDEILTALGERKK